MDLEFRIGKKGDRRARKSDEGARRIVVLGDFGGRQARGQVEAGDALAARPLVRVRQEDFDAAMAAVAPRLKLAGVAKPLEIAALEDLHPDALFRRLSLFSNPPRAPAPVGAVSVGEADADDVARLLGRKPSASASALAAEAGQGPTAAEAFIGQLVAAHTTPAPPPEAPLDGGALGGMLRAILRDPVFQELEARWRGLELLASRADEEVEVWLLDVSRDELDADLLDDGTPDAIEDTGLGQRLLSPPGRRPFSLLVCDELFAPGAEDLGLLGRLGRLAAGLGAPLIAGAAPALAGCRTLAGAVDPARWSALAGPDAERWQALRRTVQAAWIGLALPRFLARAPYGAKAGGGKIEAFPFEEIEGRPQPEALCWANGAFLCALTLVREDGSGGEEEIEDLPFFSFRSEGDVEMYPIAEVFWGQRAADAALARGLTPLLCARDRNVVRVVRLQSITDPPSALGDGAEGEGEGEDDE